MTCRQHGKIAIGCEQCAHDGQAREEQIRCGTCADWRRRDGEWGDCWMPLTLANGNYAGQPSREQDRPNCPGWTNKQGGNGR